MYYSYFWIIGAVPGTVEGQGEYPEDWGVPVCTGSEMTLNECPKESPPSARCNYALVQCKEKGKRIIYS